MRPLAGPFGVLPLSAAPLADGTIRFYLISDDNVSNSQRTLLVAFDWTPPKGN